MSPLINFKSKTRVSIQKINENSVIRKRLAGIGIVEKIEAEILHSSHRHSLILIKIGNRRIALRRKTGQNILVKRI